MAKKKEEEKNEEEFKKDNSFLEGTNSNTKDKVVK